MSRPGTLLIGYGNPGRGDDGLGPAFAARIAAAALPDLAVTSDYQLTVDHALEVSAARRVVFADALMGADDPFAFATATPARNASLSSHSLTPEGVLALCGTLYGAVPEAYVLGISGTEFGAVKEGLSAAAQHNLRAAEAFFLDWVSG